MGTHVHGGDIYRHKNVMDFSANCNPLGTPEGVKKAVRESAEKLANYPQVGYEPLRKAIGDYEGILPSQVICGNGAAELIFSLCRALKPGKALLPAPTFAEYQQALESVGCQVEHYFLKEENGFVLEEDFLTRLTGETDILFLCNPNNPTGVLTEREFLLRILEICREKNIFLAVDECFLDFIEEPEKYTLKEFLDANQNLFLLKAFTKRYAMAGVRLGYGLCANESLLENMGAVNQPWNLSVIAQEAGVAALRETEYVEAGRRLIFQERAYLKRALKELGLRVYASLANYIFFRGPENLWETCLEGGILIRDCSNYPGLQKGYFRVAVRTHEENEKLVQVLKNVLEKTEEQEPGNTHPAEDTKTPE